MTAAVVLTGDDIAVRGNATAEELGAVLAALTTRLRTPATDSSSRSRYEHWRAARLEALRRRPAR